MNEYDAFADELEKLALPGFLPSALTGGAVGGVWRAVSGYNDAREQGADIAQALQQGAISGGKGALVGSAVGAGIHGASRLPGWIGNKFKSLDETVGNYGRQQLHVVTGRGRLSDFGQGSHLTQKGVESAEQAAREAGEKLRAAPQGSDIGSRARRWWAERSAARASKRVEQATKAHDAARKAEDMELTSIPGTIRALGKYKPGEIARAGLDYQWNTLPGYGKALMVGLPVGLGALSVQQGGADAAPEAGAMAGNAVSSVLPHTHPGSLTMAMGPWSRYMPTGLISMPFEAAGRGVGHIARYALGGGQKEQP